MSFLSESPSSPAPQVVSRSGPLGNLRQLLDEIDEVGELVQREERALMKLRRDADGRSVAKTKTTERLQADRQEERRAYWPETWSGATCTDDAQPMTAMGAAEEWRHNAGQNSVRAERATPACSEIAACASGRNKLITPLQLPRYDGLSDWAEYDAQLKITANRMGWSDYETAAHLCLSLQGHAKRTLIELREEEHDDLTALRNALRARFGRQPLSAAARQRLSLRRRARGERLALLAADITLLVRQAYPTFPEEVRQRLALDRFVEALEPFELQTHVLLKDPASLDLAIEEAERAELVLSRGPTTRPTAAARPGRDTAGRRTMTCWRCGLPDHKASECTLGSSLPSRRLGINGLYTPLMVNDKPPAPRDMYRSDTEVPAACDVDVAGVDDAVDYGRMDAEAPLPPGSPATLQVPSPSHARHSRPQRTRGPPRHLGDFVTGFPI
ncbi:uncharacterized protein LOC143517766 [Brachyhypopomus gauderio]|uniref:uncharacterized protein LOC143517766 n=1 Tax=Brachyhypopomus gauderio TaxID=698409 RepID=UPI004041D199